MSPYLSIYLSISFSLSLSLSLPLLTLSFLSTFTTLSILGKILKIQYFEEREKKKFFLCCHPFPPSSPSSICTSPPPSSILSLLIYPFFFFLSLPPSFPLSPPSGEMDEYKQIITTFTFFYCTYFNFLLEK